ncbi:MULTISPECIES: rhodanese-like domain-containing protein [unclassified Desulfovibrio]|uniref:rhodanese-like domain-containing protein n=1 Tax=unclassified Desulfovibrio TaxID=2593640 RepID=UPI00069EFE01|nr:MULTISPECIES: rhodanese-like domain-containing protein [unclassified Desulfovibrio]
MLIKEVLSFVLVSLILVTQVNASIGEEYKYISPETLQGRIKAGDSSMIILDICPVEQFAKGHIPGAIETNASPAQRPEETARLEAALPKLVGDKDIIIICPGGGGGAKRTVDLYKSKGIDSKRLLILENGMNKWPYETEPK